MNNLIKRQESPDSWKAAEIALIQKSGKPLELATRPICTLNTFCKLLEVLVRTRLHKEQDEKTGLHPLQYGFRKRKSTIDAIDTVVEMVNKLNSR